ncbi:ribosylnicotinamide kinase [Diaporthe australafricana]|uniref:Ribosylnicotinamide kinase n=1 Tax=Diaporthe australafricana TaxID=127596 RepID=A0ABR3W188_9PEZI
MTGQKAVVVGVSGCSSSGKTTLARLLRDIFPNTFVLHEDDFYRPENELPMKDGLLDWDCAESLNIPDMERALSHIRSEGTFPVSSNGPDPAHTHRSSHGVATTRAQMSLRTPSSSDRLPDHNLPPTEQPFVDSKEDQNSVGKCPASDAKIDAQKARVRQWTQPGSPGHAIFSGEGAAAPRMCLLDGFLLYSPPKLTGVTDMIDVRLFLQVSHARAAQRREARDGYVTLEGFWKDPPGYVDRVVWPNYVDAHRWLFVGGNVERGELDRDVLRESRVLAQPGAAGGVDLDFEETLEWAVGEVMAELERWHKK